MLLTDVVPSIADALGLPLGSDATDVGTGLCTPRVKAQVACESTWRDVPDYLRRVPEGAGGDARQVELDLARSGSGQTGTVDGHRRLPALANAQRRRTGAGAQLHKARLGVRFGSDPARWRQP